MPICGKGLRFRSEGYSIPKPFLDVFGQPMFVRALNSLSPIKCEKVLSFVVRREYEEKWKFGEIMHEYLNNASVTILDGDTRGAVETCLHDKKLYEHKDEAVLVLDCDLWFRSKRYYQLILEVITNRSNIDGLLLGFNSNNPRYSYALVENNEVIRTAEKTVISNHALAGSYLFRSKGIFIKAATKLISENRSKLGAEEYYLSLLYNYIISSGGKILFAEVDNYFSFGTPQELKETLNSNIFKKIVS
tara:strand:+ start:1132 stop:1872 length:741 start_codon:yes stop_codon:yes gene_type:complete